jgi:hypothetical protein
MLTRFVSLCRFVVLNYVGYWHRTIPPPQSTTTAFALRDMKFFSHPIVAFLLGFGSEVVIAVAVQRSSDMLDGILRYGSELYLGVPRTQTEVAPPIVPCLATGDAPIARPSVPPVAERTISTPVLLLGGAVTLSTSVIGVAYVVLYRRSRELQQRLTQLEAANTALMQHAAELQVANTIAVVKHATLAESVTELQTMNAAAAAEHDTRVQLENSLYELFGSLRASYSSAMDEGEGRQLDALPSRDAPQSMSANSLGLAKD